MDAADAFRIANVLPLPIWLVWIGAPSSLLARTLARAACLLVLACGGGAKELLETAQFEELQRNTTHARELYEQIVRDHPDAPEAAKARERLAALKAN